MFGGLIALLLLFIGGILAILFSILSWRTKEAVYFYLGIGFTSLILIYILVNIKFVVYQLSNGTSAIEGIITLSFLVIPILFLVKTKQKHSAGGEDSEVTDAFLDDIINSEDEDIDYE